MKEVFIKAAEINSYDIKSLNNINEKQLYEFLSREFDTILGYNKNIKMNQGRLEKFKVPNAVISNYDHKFIEIEKNKKVLAGIRHVGGNPEKPFIYLWPGYVIENIQQITAIKEKLLPYFKLFNPQYLNMWFSKKSPFYEELNKLYKPVQKLYVGEIDNIISKEYPDNYNFGGLKKINDEEYYNWYISEYELFHNKHPEFLDWVEVNSLELMEECRADNLLFLFEDDRKRIGLIAGEKNRIFNEEAVYIDEILISEECRGKGYASSLMRKFIECIPTDMKYVWSHIDSRNLSSSRTAVKIGQRPISEEYFIKLS